MQLVAIHQETGERVDITQYEKPREIFPFGSLRCQMEDCGKLLMIKDGAIMARHLAHEAVCITSYKSHPESEEHLAGKAFLAERLPVWFSEFTSVKFQLEVPVKEVMRIADIMAIFPNGWRIAHEVQLSPITVKELDDRINDYQRAGIDSWWWFGKENANSPALQNYCHSHGIRFRTLRFERRTHNEDLF